MRLSNKRVAPIDSKESEMHGKEIRQENGSNDYISSWSRYISDLEVDGRHSAVI